MATSSIITLTLIDPGRPFYFLSLYILKLNQPQEVDLSILTTSDIHTIIVSINAEILSSDHTVEQIKAVLSNNTDALIVETIAERDALTDVVDGDKVMVLDSGDGTWAKYQMYNGSWVLIESENDGVVSLALGDLTDVDPTGQVDGYALKWDTATNQYIFEPDEVGTELTATDIKTLYESNADTNAFTDALLTKLNGIEANAKGDQIASEVPFTSSVNISSINVQTAIEEVYAEKADVSHTHSEYSLTTHTHDDRYYTETEINNLLSNKSDTTHTHNDLYYTESEINTLLAGKADESHTHAISEVIGLQTALNGKADTNHNHDGIYEPADPNIQAHLTDTSNPHNVTAAQVGNNIAQWNASLLQGVNVSTTSPQDGQILQYDLATSTLVYANPPSGTGGESNTGANIGLSGIGVYSGKNSTTLEFKNIDSGNSGISITDDVTNSTVDISVNFGTTAGTVAEGNHTHAEYSLTTHNHDSQYSDINHDHDLDYAPISHAHDSRYYTETEIDTMLSGYSSSTHNHDTEYAIKASEVPSGGLTGQVLAKATDTNYDYVWTDAGSGTGSSTLEGLSDTVLEATIATGELLVYDGVASAWKNKTSAEAGLASATHNHDSSYASIDHTHALGDLSNVSAVAPTDGYSLVWNATSSIWEPQSVSGGTGASNLVDLGDVNITSITDGEIIVWDSVSSTYINQTLAEAGISSSAHNHDGIYEPADPALQAHLTDTNNPHNVTASQVGNTAAQWNADQIQSVAVATTAPADGQVLAYNATSSQYEPVDQASGTSGGGSGDSYRITLGVGSTMADRIAAATNVPAGWSLSTADVAGFPDLGTDPDTIVVIHNTGKLSGVLIAHEIAEGGPPGTNGYIQINLTTGQEKNSLDLNAAGLIDLQNYTNQSRKVEIFMHLL